MPIQPRVGQIGQTGGLMQMPLNASQLPAHIHEIPLTPADNSTTNSTATNNSTGPSLPATEGTMTKIRRLNNETSSTFTNSTGLSLPIDTFQPWLAVNYIISTFGYVSSSRARGRQLGGIDYVGRIVPVSETQYETLNVVARIGSNNAPLSPSSQTGGL